MWNNKKRDIQKRKCSLRLDIFLFQIFCLKNIKKQQFTASRHKTRPEDPIRDPPKKKKNTKKRIGDP